MKHVKFLPWVGENYQSGFNGLRTLVLGESHYESSNNLDISNSTYETIECIKEQVTGEWTKAFWTKIASAFIGREPALEDKQAFWHSVTIYNYIQESAGFGPRTRPRPESWEVSKLPFEEVLLGLKPNLVVVLGYELWNRLPDLNERNGPRIESSPEPRTYIYPLSLGGGLLFNIIHPSSAFSPQECHKLIVAAQEKARELLMATANP